MANVQERLLELRRSLNPTQQKLSKLTGVSQTAINRYEHGQTSINANAPLKYANFFDVSADYILGRCDDPRGKSFDYQPEYVRNKLANSGEGQEFVEMCFEPGSVVNNKLKEMILQMADDK